MNTSILISHTLAIGRRVFFVLLAMALLAGVTGWLFAPDLKTVRPEIEAFLQEELELKELSLGELSWYWAGSLGLKANTSSFINRDASIAVHNSRITVQISTMELLSGRFTPSRIRLSGGVVDLVVEVNGDSGQREIPPLVTLEDTELHWRFGEQFGQLDHFTLLLDAEERVLQARSPGAHINIRMGEKRFPEQIDVSFSNLDWMPQGWHSKLNGAIAGELGFKQNSSNSWLLDLAVTSMGESSAVLSAFGAKWAFDSLKGELVLTSDINSNALSQLDAKSLEWRLGRNMLHAAGLWDDGKLQMSVTSPYLEMPLVWNSLKPLGSESWHAWLAKMQRGIASEVRAEVGFPWAEPWRGFPSKSELSDVHYHLNAHVEEADIALGTHEESLTRTEADVELDEKGLNAIVISTQLPDKIGSVSGGMHMPWKTLVLDITGHGKMDAGKVHSWVDQKAAALMKWSAAPANTNFSIQWMPGEEKPKKASINFEPIVPWSLEIEQVPVQVTSGVLGWTLGAGVQFTGLEWSTAHLNVKTDLSAVRSDMNQWHVLSLRAKAEGKLNRLVSYFLLPIESADGQLRMALNFDGEWHGNIDLTDASWENFLGMKKVAGRNFSIEYSGVNATKQGKTTLLIKDIHCNDKLFRLRGSGNISKAGLRLKFNQIETGSFSGAIDIQAPFGPEPWELGVDASYLNHNALSASLSHDSNLKQKPWALRANLERFVWDDAEIRGVSIKLASTLNSIAVLKATSLHSGEISMKNISSVFSLPGGGVVDLRSFEAEMDELHLKMSAMLTPESKRGMHWRGIAEMDGNFGDMMKKAELSNIFEDGEMYTLFSGQGEFFSKQPWWKGLNGRVRMRVDDGRIQKGGTLSKFLAAISLVDLPALFFGSRDDLTKPGIGYKRLQMEATIHGKDVKVYKLAMRSSAMDVAGKGVMDIDSSHVDLMLVMRPFQNLDALLSKVPLIRDIFGGAANSLFRKVYRMHGPIADAEVEPISPGNAGLASTGAVEHLLNVPETWFGKEKAEPNR
ncbi:MAG: AsmA-like C-terminal domain-containing protein [Mariprofundaceae bacterium]